MQPGYITLEKLPGKLRLTLTPKGREELEAKLVPADENHTDKYNWKEPHNTILQDLLEDHLCNGWEWLEPEEIGALTAAPLLSDSVLRNDKNEVTDYENVYWFPEYAVTSELEELLDKGFVDFTRAGG